MEFNDRVPGRTGTPFSVKTIESCAMRIHPQDFVLLKTLKSSPRGLERILEHIETCAKCRSRRSAALPPAADRFRRSTEPDYEPALDRSFQVFESRRAALARERSAAPGLSSRLTGLPFGRQQLLVRNSRRFQTWGLLELLIQEGTEETFTDPSHAEEIFRLALEVSGYLESSFYGKERIEDIRARALGYTGNLLRVRRLVSAAEEVFKEAFSRLRKGTADSLEKAILLDLKSSLRREQQRHKEALRLSKRAIAIFASAGEYHSIGRALIGSATSLSYSGNDRGALLLVSEALDLIDPVREPRLVLCALHNLSDYLINLGRLTEAQRVLRRFRSLNHQQLGGLWLESRHLWVAGRLAFRLGRYREAEVLLVKARAGFLSLGDSTDSTLVSRELALVGTTATGFS